MSKVIIIKSALLGASTACCLGVLACDKGNTSQSENASSPLKSRQRLPATSPDNVKSRARYARDDGQSSEERQRSLLDAANAGDLEKVTTIAAGMTVEELRAVLEDGAEELTERALGTLLLSFAAKAGPEGQVQDLQLILSSKLSTMQIGSSLKKFFELARDGAGAERVWKYVDALGPGAKRDAVVRAYFGSADFTLAEIFSQSADMAFPEDRRNALMGAAASRDWTPDHLGPLTRTKQDEELIKLFLRRYIANWISSGDDTLVKRDWNKLLALPDADERAVLQKSLLSEIGRQDPRLAFDLAEGASPEGAQMFFADPGAAKAVRSWCDKDPLACLNYVASANIDSANSANLVSAGVGQWLQIDSMAASGWVSQNLDKPFAPQAVARVIQWLESKGENAEEWKSTLDSLQAKR